MSNKFPKIKSLKDYNKEFKFDIPEDIKPKNKELKLLVGRKDIILGDTTALINLTAIIKPNTKDIDKSRLIKLIRMCCDLKPNIAFYGWNSLMLRLGIQYGSKQCLDKTLEIKNFIIKHGKAYKEYINAEQPFSWVKPDKDILNKRYDRLLCSEDETSKLKNMWVKPDDNYYVLYDDFYTALLNYGYTKEQLRRIIHVCSQSGNYDAIPAYLRKKYLAIPDGSPAMNKLLYNGENKAC